MINLPLKNQRPSFTTNSDMPREAVKSLRHQGSLAYPSRSLQTVFSSIEKLILVCCGLTFVNAATNVRGVESTLGRCRMTIDLSVNPTCGCCAAFSAVLLSMTTVSG